MGREKEERLEGNNWSYLGCVCTRPRIRAPSPWLMPPDAAFQASNGKLRLWQHNPLEHTKLGAPYQNLQNGAPSADMAGDQ